MSVLAIVLDALDLFLCGFRGAVCLVLMDDVLMLGKVLSCSGAKWNPSNKLNAAVATMKAPIVFSNEFVEAGMFSASFTKMTTRMCLGVRLEKWYGRCTLALLLMAVLIAVAVLIAQVNIV